MTYIKAGAVVVPVPTAPIVLAQNWNTGTSGNGRQEVSAFQPDRVGRWVVAMVGRKNAPGGGRQSYWLVIDGLGDVAFGDCDSTLDSDMYATIGLQYLATPVLGPANWIRTHVDRAGGGAVTGTTWIYFIPTQANPS